MSQQSSSARGPNVVSITPDRTIADAANLLTENRIGAVLVMDSNQGIRGMISLSGTSSGRSPNTARMR